jgi:hypothetical protein
MQVCFVCTQILMSSQTAHTMATSHLDTNVTINLIMDTKNESIFNWALFMLSCPFSSGISDYIQKSMCVFALMCILHALFCSWPNIYMYVPLLKFPEIAFVGLAKGLK